jgi:anti-sigma regulatory factor (Ser/Thr protein kinase)
MLRTIVATTEMITQATSGKKIRTAASVIRMTFPERGSCQTARFGIKVCLIEVRTMLNRHPTSVGAARRFVRDVLMSRQVADGVVDTVELLTSEVVTNAIVHGGSGPQLVVDLGDDVIRVSVGDLSPGLPVRRLSQVDDVSGRGVVIVEELASAWGVQRQRGGGKQVWFEVAC